MSNIIIGTGSYLPERVVTNHDIEAVATDYVRKPDGPTTLHDWAHGRHGAASRHHAAPGETISEMALRACQGALEKAGIPGEAIDLIVLATFSDHQRMPPAAASVQSTLSRNAKYIQIDAACSGFIDGLLVTDALMNSGAYHTALVVGVDAVSRWNDPRKFLAQTIFGDGAGAAVVQRRNDLAEHGIRAFCTGSDGDLGHYVEIPNSDSAGSAADGVPRTQAAYLQYKFPLIQPYGTDRLVRGAREAVQRSGITLADVTWVVPHQASTSILREVARRLEVPFDKFVVTYETTGNTSAASIPIALDYAHRNGTFSSGDWLVMPSAGGGLAWGAVAYRWHDDHDHR